MAETIALEGLKNAWMNPRGELITQHPLCMAPQSFHVELAKYIWADLNELDPRWMSLSDDDDVYWADHLEARGWIKLHSWGGMWPRWIILDQHLTKRQRDTILAWCTANGMSRSDIADAYPNSTLLNDG